MIGWEAVAKALGCHDDKSRFEAKLWKIANTTPKNPGR